MSALDNLHEISMGLGKPDDRPERLRQMPSAMDSTALYYRFLYELARNWKPNLQVEIGTFVGSSCAHMAMGHPGGVVVTIDMDFEATRIAGSLDLPNLWPIHSASALAVKQIGCLRDIDILFIDGNHCFNNCYGEYVLYRPLVRQGGIILFDDIDLDAQMKTAWKYILDEKRSLPSLHYTGFGACVVNHEIDVPSWDEVAPKAALEFKA